MEKRVPEKHPLRQVRALLRDVPQEMSRSLATLSSATDFPLNLIADNLIRIPKLVAA